MFVLLIFSNLFYISANVFVVVSSLLFANIITFSPECDRLFYTFTHPFNSLSFLLFFGLNFECYRRMFLIYF